MRSRANPLEARERQVIKAGTEILGGVLLTRAGIVVDVEENPGPYQAVLDDIDAALAWQAANTTDDVRSTYNILRKVNAAVNQHLPYYPLVLTKMLKDEALSRGLERVGPEHEIGLSSFLSVGGVCHQHALLSGTALRLLQERGDLGGKVSLESTKPDELHPDRHTRVAFSEPGADFTLDMVSGVWQRQ